MYAFNGTTDCVGANCEHDQVDPLGPNAPFSTWWMRSNDTMYVRVPRIILTLTPP